MGITMSREDEGLQGTHVDVVDVSVAGGGGDLLIAFREAVGERGFYRGLNVTVDAKVAQSLCTALNEALAHILRAATVASPPAANDPRPAIVAQFVELIHSHFRGRASEAANAAQELRRLGVTVHLEPRPEEAAVRRQESDGND